MSDIGICEYCKHIDKDIIEKPCLHCGANLGAFEFDLSEHDAKVIADFTNKLLDTLCNGYCYPTQSFEDGVIEVVKDAIRDIEQKEAEE